MGIFPNRSRAVKEITRGRKRIPIKNGMVGIWGMLGILASAVETREIGYNQTVDYGVSRWIGSEVFVTKSRLRDIDWGGGRRFQYKQWRRGEIQKIRNGF